MYNFFIPILNRIRWILAVRNASINRNKTAIKYIQKIRRSEVKYDDPAIIQHLLLFGYLLYALNRNEEAKSKLNKALNLLKESTWNDQIIKNYLAVYARLLFLKHEAIKYEDCPEFIQDTRHMVEKLDISIIPKYYMDTFPLILGPDWTKKIKNKQDHQVDT